MLPEATPSFVLNPFAYAVGPKSLLVEYPEVQLGPLLPDKSASVKIFDETASKTRFHGANHGKELLQPSAVYLPVCCHARTYTGRHAD